MDAAPQDDDSTDKTILNLVTVLPEPARRPGVQGHVAWRRLGLLAERADALVGRPRIELLPHDVALTSVDRVHDLVGILLGEVGARVERPGAVVDTGVILRQPISPSLANTSGSSVRGR